MDIEAEAIKEAPGFIARVFHWLGKMFSNGQDVSSTRFIVVFGVTFILITGTTLAFIVVFLLYKDPTKVTNIAAILAAISGGMVAEITALIAVLGYNKKQELNASKE
jgi:Zn-dependent protease with chaperone function